MAKQATIGSGVVAAAREVSAVQGRFQDFGGQFMAGYEKAMKSKDAREAENKAIQAQANKYIGQFDSYVDLVDYADEEKNLVKNTVVGYRNEFIDLANELARTENKGSARALELQDGMNDIRSKMERLRGNLEGLAKLKVEYAADFDAKAYSNSSKNTDNVLRANAILEGKISGIGADGSLNFDGYSVPVMQPDGSFTDIKTEGFSYSTKNFKKPFKVAKAEAAEIINLADKQAVAKGPMLDHVRKGIELQVNDILSNDDALYSILSNSELQLIPLNSIDPDDPNARETAVQMITQAIVDARGSVLTESDKPKGGKDTRTTQQKNDAANRTKINSYYDTNVASFTIEDLTFENQGDEWAILDADGLPVLNAAGQPKKARTKEDIYAALGL